MTNRQPRTRPLSNFSLDPCTKVQISNLSVKEGISRSRAVDLIVDEWKRYKLNETRKQYDSLDQIEELNDRIICLEQGYKLILHQLLKRGK